VCALRRENRVGSIQPQPHPQQLRSDNATTPDGAIPANVSETERAIVTAGLANDVKAVNQ
jgi:hypothetical protein